MPSEQKLATLLSEVQSAGGEAQQALRNNTPFVASECPLAADHLMQVMELTAEDGPPKPSKAHHPIELFAKAYGLVD